MDTSRFSHSRLQTFRLNTVLRHNGCDLKLVNDGQALVNSVPDNDACDIIITDINMPGMDGFQASYKLRQMGINTPIIAITGNATNVDRGKGDSLFQCCVYHACLVFIRRSNIDVALAHFPAITSRISADAFLNIGRTRFLSKPWTKDELRIMILEVYNAFITSDRVDEAI